ncbi:MAG TPA: sodium:solute symporter [Bacteroidia bacterium]|nr:sodium:solute symporter [Bacteroidia bacterium]
MHPLDIIVLLGTLGFIVVYGAIKTRGQKDMHSYLRSGGEKKWWAICLSIMATQASAITFISTPGQAYESGVGFIQIYFGLPLAMIVISAVFIPKFYSLNVYTAYEYLEGRFNVQTRYLIAFFFLLSRSLGAGITIYAPAIILSTLFGLNLNLLCLLIGLAVIIYIYVGGERAVSQTQVMQMTVILSGMAVALFMLIKFLPTGVSLTDAVYIAGKMGKMKAVDTHFNFDERYNLWSGLLGGFFLSLSYFGTDQSQVSRYLGGESVNQSKLGLFFNGMVKIPMQFFILFIGVMMYVFFLFHHSPVFFNNTALEKANLSAAVKQQIADREKQHSVLEIEINQATLDAVHQRNTPAESASIEKVKSLEAEDQATRADVKQIIKTNAPGVETHDTDYVFLEFVLHNLPVGIVGLLLAVMFCAAMSSTAGQISSLASTTIVDFYQRAVHKNASQMHYVSSTKIATLLWGAITVGFAITLPFFDNLIQAVNILGSLFYGTLLGVFLVAFFFKKIEGRAAFYASLITELVIINLHIYLTVSHSKLSYLWYNPIGALLVIVLSYAITLFSPSRTKAA